MFSSDEYQSEWQKRRDEHRANMDGIRAQAKWGMIGGALLATSALAGCFWVAWCLLRHIGAA